MNNEENPIEEESFTKTSNNFEFQIDNLKKEFEFQNQQKNQELEIFFEEINNENQELKKELFQTKLELEEEKQKTKNIKNTFLNINSNNIFPSLQDETKSSELPSIDKNYIYLNDHIRIIKENNEKKILELNTNKEYKINNFSEEKKIFMNNLNKIGNKQSIGDYAKNIVEESEKILAETESLINDNYNKDKYIIALEEKYEISKEEIHFLKERIFQEKINILEKINDINGVNKLNYFHLVQELQNELEENHKNFYNEQILGPLENINLMITNIKNNEREINNNKYKLECENELLKNKLVVLEQEKNELLKKTSDFIFDKESIISENLLNKSEVNKLKNEIQIIQNENNNLLKNIKDLNEELLNIKNKMNFDMKKIEDNNNIIISQKESLIKELSNKNQILLKNNLDSKKNITELKEQVSNLEQELTENNNKEKKLQKQILELQKKFGQDLLTSNDFQQKHSVTEVLNKNLSEKLELLQSEKKEMENTSNILNNKYNNVNIEFNKVKAELNLALKKNNELESELVQLRNKLTSSENIQNLLQAESDLLHKIQKGIKEIYLIHCNDNNTQPASDDALIMLQNIKEKLSTRNTAIGNQELQYNGDFANLENSKNSQLYENILLYIINIKSQNKIELAKILTDKNSNALSHNNSGDISQSMTHNSSSNYFNKKYLEEFKYILEDKYRKLEERIRQSIMIGELHELLNEFKSLYETIIDNIIKSFYIYKKELSGNNILRIEIPLDKYHQIINNTNDNLISIEKSLNKKLIEYKGQGEKIESALTILLNNVNMIL